MKLLITSVTLVVLTIFTGCGHHSIQINDTYTNIRKIHREQQIDVIRQEIQTGKYVAASNRYNLLLNSGYLTNNHRRHLINLAVLALLAEDMEHYKSISDSLNKYEKDPVARFHLALSKYVKDNNITGFSKKERKVFASSSSREQHLIHKWIRWLKQEESGIGLADELIKFGDLPNPTYVGSMTGFIIPILDDLLGIHYFQIIF